MADEPEPKPTCGGAQQVSVRVLYSSLLLLLVAQLTVSWYLYAYIANVERQCEGNVEKHIERKRDTSAVLEENTIDDQHIGVLRQTGMPEDIETDEEMRTVTGVPGKDWIPLTSHVKIPLAAIQGFCSATKEYCPPGTPGSPGPQGIPGLRGSSGPKGDRGDRGMPGEMGLRGPQGVHGEAGERGTKGHPGRPGSKGLDGRDGVPGEPGLDGIPGRSGLDGMPGMDGLPGINGIPGIPGINGTNGRPGAVGPAGPPGPKGPKGIAGPRGRVGRPGTNGTPGLPGISAYTVRINGSVSNELLVPPSIVISGTPLAPKPIIVQEGDNVRLRCAATGIPRPTIEWRKLDGSTIPMGSWQVVSVTGHTVNITRVNRKHMGTYMCIADNGIPPPANQTFDLEVHFPPLITIQNQLVGVGNGSTAVLECDVEAYPDPLRYWERSDGRLLEHGSKHKIEFEERISHKMYKSRMQLNITKVGPADYGMYHCIGKNEVGMTKGIFNVFGVDPRQATPPPPQLMGKGTAVYGPTPPPQEDVEEICPPPVVCRPECPDPREIVKCHDGGISLFNLASRMEIRPFENITFPELPVRSLDCQLYAVGKPVYHRYTDAIYGSWMRDSLPRPESNGEKFWVTNETDPYHLFEFANKSAFRKDVPTKTYKLDHPFKGNAHVIYNGSFYYNERDKPQILKYDLATGSYKGLTVPKVATNGSNYLYTTDFNYMDFSVDDNGLWVIYGLPENNNTVVMKVDAATMEKQNMWNISVNHHKVGEMFVVCGVLYAVNSVIERNTKILFALDLYKKILLDVNLNFTNPFRRTTMIGYNHRNKELYTWDKGNQLTYPIRYHEIGYNNSSREKGEPEASAQVQTGFDVFS